MSRELQGEWRLIFLSTSDNSLIIKAFSHESLLMHSFNSFRLAVSYLHSILKAKDGGEREYGHEEIYGTSETIEKMIK